MHIPSSFKEKDLTKLYEFIEAYPLGTLVTCSDVKLDADHIPFYLKRENNGGVSLQSHIAKVNPLWKHCSEGQEVLLIFHGPSAFISPNFYPSKKETGKVVPTWNYSVVHVRGRLYFKHDSAWLLQQLNDISDFHELSQSTPWSVGDAPESFTNKLMKAIIGLEVVIEDIVGQFKQSQNKSESDYLGVLKGLEGSDDINEQSAAQHMRKLSARYQ